MTAAVIARRDCGEALRKRRVGAGLLRCARNDGVATILSVIARSASDEAIQRLRMSISMSLATAVRDPRAAIRVDDEAEEVTRS